MAKEIPFVFGVPAKGSNFTDRVAETKRLIANFTYGVNTILISPRRWGKTSLVRKAAAGIKSKDIKTVYIDIFGCHDEWEFYAKYAQEIVKQTATKIEEWVESAKQFLSHLAPKFSFGADPLNDFSITFDVRPRLEDRDELLRLPARIAKAKGISIVLCIDEFQQIAEFKDSLYFQKRLRSVWQHLENVSFCLFGSKKHMMNELFDAPSKPFYKFGDIINLERISAEDWIKYITMQFESTGKSISVEMAGKICERVELNSSYVQQLAWIVWTISDDVVKEADLEQAFQLLLDQNNSLFEKQIESLSASQLNYLKAMVAGVASSFSRKEVIETYDLGSSANVAALQKILQRKEIIFIENKISYFSDPLLGVWLKRRKL